jgi:cardiolipin synthase
VQAVCEGEITYDLAERKRKEDIMGKKKQMRSEVKGNVKNSIGRIVFAALAVLLQIGWILILMIKLYQYSSVISLLTSLFALVVALRIYGKHTNAAFKMPWIIVILAFPVFGLCIYGLFGHKEAMHKIIRKFEDVDAQLIPLNVQDETILQQLEQEDPLLANQCHYIWKYGNYPVYDTTTVKFYPEAYLGYEEQLKELEKAKHFIFLEYHAIEEAEAFARLKDVLARKAAEGVEVRILYDDVGCIGFLDKSFIDRMNAIGVQCRVFNYVVPFLNIFMNNRDHRKIMVIDGKVGFTGGYNLADEYFNITHPYGYWKDTGVKLTGRAVQNFTMMFLEMWNVMGQADTDYEKYLKASQEGAEDGNVQKASGYVQPYADSPLDGEPVGENVYLNLIKTAKKRLYVATPYLIISDEMTRELGLAAKRGVDVRVFTPGIPDKKIIYGVTRSYYSGLVRQGVRVYEYTPGFLHAKQMLCDGDTATVGTINMDYRSLYHHFENGVWMHGCDAIRDIEADFDKLLQDSEEVTDKYRDGRKNMAVRGWQCIMRLIAPLL